MFSNSYSLFIQKGKFLNCALRRAWGNRDRAIPTVCTSKIQVYLDVLYLNLEPNFAGLGPPRGKNLNDMGYLALALSLGKNQSPSRALWPWNCPTIFTTIIPVPAPHHWPGQLQMPHEGSSCCHLCPPILHNAHSSWKNHFQKYISTWDFSA